jgi:glycosyltransferase involved in cell wall biosynthesis
MFVSILEKCDLFVTTTDSARAVITVAYEFLKERSFSIIPHGRDFDAFLQLAVPLTEDENIRIVVPGNITTAKGAKIISELGRLAGEGRFEIHILGRMSVDVEVSDGIVCHGPYQRERFAEKVAEIRPHLGGVFSIWPETYCHTLTELWACGVPVIGFDFGAVGERLRESTAGWLTAEPTAQGVLQILERLRNNGQEHRKKLEVVRGWQGNLKENHNCARMGDAYFDLYRSVKVGITAEEDM